MSDALPYRLLRTPTGVAYGVLTPVQPTGPTLLLLAMGLHEALAVHPYNLVGRHLQAQGWNVASLDLPGHGEDTRPGEPGGLATWAQRVAAGEDLVGAWQTRARAVLDALVASGVADPHALAAAGTSRAGYAALQVAAADPRLRAVAAFAPVTDLRALSEFASQKDEPRCAALALTAQVTTLAACATWISIGNADDRVGTAPALALTQALVATSRAQNRAPEHTLHLHPTPGHLSEPAWHAEAAEWLQYCLRARYQELPPPGQAHSTPCMVYPPRPATRPAGLVIHLYGSGGSIARYNLQRSSFARLRQALHERGYYLVVPELGAGNWLRPEAEARLTAIIEHLVTSQQVAPDRIHLLGTSMGGFNSLAYAARHAAKLRSVVALFPITDHAEWALQFPHRGDNFSKAHQVPPELALARMADYSPINHTEAFAKLPVFLLHGDADPVVPVSHSRRFAELLRARGQSVTYHEVHGAKHDNDIAILWQEAMMDFIARHDGAGA